MKKTVLTIWLIMSCWLYPSTISAEDVHWAEKELSYVKRIEGISINKPDSPASVGLQRRIFKIAGLDIVPQQDLIRYRLLKYMTDLLELPAEEETEVLHTAGSAGGFIDECDY